MKITVLTSNKRRHNYFVNLLSNCCDELFVIQENSTIYPGINKGSYNVSKVTEEYFKKVINAEVNLFGNTFIDSLKGNIKILPLGVGDINNEKILSFENFFKSDLYIVFGTSYIKSKLINFLIKHKAINIHMGISPYYRGTDCNFWALYDNNPHLVGATIHLISKGLDNGPVLYHAISNLKDDPYNYSMSTVKAAFYSLEKKIKNQTIFKIKSINQNKKKELRYSKKVDFSDEIILDFNKKNINIKQKKFDLSLFKEPFLLSD